MTTVVPSARQWWLLRALNWNSSPSQWTSLAQKSIRWTVALSTPQKTPTLPQRDYVSPSSFCVTLSNVALSLLLLLCLSAMYSRPWTEVPLRNNPSFTATQTTSSIFSANHALEKSNSLISWRISNWPSSLLLYFSCWWINDHDLISNQRLRLK